MRRDRVKLVRLKEEPGRLYLDPRYATDNNVFKRQLYTSPDVFLVEEVADAIRRVSDRLADQHGLALKIWDAYRPPLVQRQMRRLLPAEQRQYVADPDIGSVHSRGCAVDVTLVEEDGTDIAMPTEFDAFSEQARRETVFGLPDTDDRRRYFQWLDECMQEGEFEGHELEWWHYDFRNWRRYPLLDIEVYRQAASDHPHPVS